MQAIVRKAKKYWVLSLLAFSLTVTGTTWKIADELRIQPLSANLAALQFQLSRFQACEAQSLESGTVRLGGSWTTLKGNISLSAQLIDGDTVTFRVMIEDKPTVGVTISVGERMRVAMGTHNYYIDVTGIRGDTVDVSVSQSLTTPWA